MSYCGIMDLASSRDNAKRTIMAGLVMLTELSRLNLSKFDVDSEFKVKDKLLKYASRGGLAGKGYTII